MNNRKKYYEIYIMLFIGFSFARGQQVPRSYVAHRTIDVIEVDGKANEKSWKNAEWSEGFIDIEGVEKPTYKTQMKMLWDETYLYFYAEMEEPHVWATLKQRDTVIFYNNDFEIFIDPDGDTHDYMEFEMNALNTVWELLLTKPYRNHPKVIDGWDINGLKTGVDISGTLNDSKNTDKGWSVEIAMPWEALKEANTHGKLPVNEFWRINFSRVNWDFDMEDGRYSRKKGKNGKFLPEYNWVWSPQGVINMHEPEHWGYVYFSDKPVGTDASFTIPEDEHVKWFLYEKYREINGQEDKSDITLEPREILGKTIAPQFEMHSLGWNISVESPFTGNVLSIREDGKFESKPVK